MARRNRIKVQSDHAIYHCTTRTIRKSFLFKSQSMREWIYKRISYLSSVYFVDLYAIAVLSNHYHIVFRMKKPYQDSLEIQKRFNRLQKLNRLPKMWTGDTTRWHEKLTDLSEFMKEINQAIAVETNRRQASTGHVWEGRFRSQVVEPGPGLLACMAYVELNPVRAKLCRKPSEYRWCSVGRYRLGGAKAAGVVMPKMAEFSKLQDRHHQKALAHLVDHLALSEERETTPLTGTWEEWAEKMDLEILNDFKVWCLQKSKWTRNSFVIGSATFCKEMVVKWGLQNCNRGNPKAFHLFGGVCNTKSRCGPFLS